MASAATTASSPTTTAGTGATNTPTVATCRLCEQLVVSSQLLAHSADCREVQACTYVIDQCNENLATIITAMERLLDQRARQRCNSLNSSLNSNTTSSPSTGAETGRSASGGDAPSLTAFQTEHLVGSRTLSPAGSPTCTPTCASTPTNIDPLVVKILQNAIHTTKQILILTPKASDVGEMSSLRDQLVRSTRQLELPSTDPSFAGASTTIQTFAVLKLNAVIDRLDRKLDAIKRLALVCPTAIVVPTSEAGLPKLDDFEILRSVSRGAFGEVFLTRKKSTHDYFAIKALKKIDVKRKNQLYHVMNERNLMAQIDSPFVIQLFYSFQTVDSLYMVMEYATGGDVHMLLQSVGQLTEPWALFYIAEVILALEHIHSLGIVHRDIKPDNLLISATGHIKLADFGLSKDCMPTTRIVSTISKNEIDHYQHLNTANVTLSHDRIETKRDHLEQRRAKRTALYSYVGSPDYMAPEVIRGAGHDTALDWWCVGVCLYEFLVGLPPFFDESYEQTYINILKRHLDWPEDMSPRAADLIDKLLALNPNNRLGAKGASEIKSHPFFETTDWQNMATMTATYYRPLSSQGVTSGVPRQQANQPLRLSSFQVASPSVYLDPPDDTRNDETIPLDDETSIDHEKFLPFHFKNLRLLEDMNKHVYNQTSQTLPTQSIIGDDQDTVKPALHPVACKTSCLVAEDNPVTQVLIRALMKQMGIDIVQAYTGIEAVQLAMSQSFDLIFMDIMMPGLEGTEATRQIRQDPQSMNRKTPVIAFTALSDWTNDDYTKHGMNDMLTKPVLKSELYHCIQKWLHEPAPSPKLIS